MAEFRLTPEQAIAATAAFYERLTPRVPPGPCENHLHAPNSCSDAKHDQIVKGVAGFPDWLNFLAALCMTFPAVVGVRCRCCTKMLTKY